MGNTWHKKFESTSFENLVEQFYSAFIGQYSVVENYLQQIKSLSKDIYIYVLLLMWDDKTICNGLAFLIIDFVTWICHKIWITHK